MSNRDSSKFRLEPREYRLIPGTNYGTPKELWGFVKRGGPGTPRQVAERFLKANATLLGLEDFPIEWWKTRESVGGSHVIFDQHFGSKRIHRAYVTVHMNRKHEIYLVKNRAIPLRLLHGHVREELGLRLDRGLDEAYRAARDSAARSGGRVKNLQAAFVWFPVRGTVRRAFKFRFAVTRKKPRLRHEWIIYVDAETNVVLSRHDILAKADGRARIFNPNPVVALGDWNQLLDDGKPVDEVPDRAYETVALRDIGESGVLGGKHSRVNTSRTKHRVRRPQHDFTDIKNGDRGFEELMAYFHIDRAIRYVEKLGYRGERSIFTSSLPVNARATSKDNSQYQAYYSPYEGVIEFGYGGVDDAEDGETIVHEFGHALQDKICTDFGQSAEGNAMGEGFGDYLAASFFAAKKSDAKALLPTVISWDAITSHDPDHPDGPPCLRRVDSSLTFESFNHARTANAHRNGKIWSATLWDIWNKIGRNDADRIIIESHFQLDPFTTFARGARAIIDAGRNLADRNVIEQAHTSKLRRIFHRRGIGPVE
jgi:hypothetical protein